MNGWEKELMSLSVPSHDKIDFLLVTGDFKFGSEFWVRQKDFKSSLLKVKKFLEKMEMKFGIKKKKGLCLVFYSKNDEILKKMLDCYQDKDWILGEKEHRILGGIYGFPDGAVELFAKTMKSDYLKKNFKETDELLTIEEAEEKYKDTFWIDYLSYRIRKKYPEDIEIAKKWASFILKEYPDFDRFLKK